MTFDEAYNEILANEGGYVNDPKDSGGETYKGIARNHWPNWGGWWHIDKDKDKNWTDRAMNENHDLQNEVRNFYRGQYWNKLKCEQLPHEIRLELFDTAINQGMSRAGRYLQRALNLLNRNGKDYADIAVDGKIGNATAGAAMKCKNKNALFVTLNVLQGQRYVKITEANPKNERFFNGWISRRVAL